MTPMIYNYSLAIMPPAPISDLVKELKLALKKELSVSFSSVNAEAHISLDSFDAEEDHYPLILEEYSRLIAGEKPISISFSGFSHFDGYYPSFYVRIEDNSKEEIRSFYGRVRQNLDPEIKKQYMRKWINETKEPHMTVGRKLKPDWIKIAYRLFPEFEQEFLCSQVAIRQFKPEWKQYRVLSTIDLEGKKGLNGSQLPLFG